MVKATVSSTATYTLTLSGLTQVDIQTLRSFVQNSPHGYNPMDEPENEWKLREAIHDACLEILK